MGLKALPGLVYHMPGINKNYVKGIGIRNTQVSESVVVRDALVSA